MKQRKLSENELATEQWHRLIKGHKRKEYIIAYSRKRYRTSRQKLKAPPIQSVASCIAKYYNLSYDRLLNCRHNKITSRYRWLLFYICKHVLNYSFRKITSGLGLAEGTVYRGLIAFKELMLIDPGIITDIQAIRIQLNRKYAK